MVLYKTHTYETANAKTNQYCNRKTGECAYEHILCNFYVFSFVQFSESEN